MSANTMMLVIALDTENDAVLNDVTTVSLNLYILQPKSMSSMANPPVPTPIKTRGTQPTTLIETQEEEIYQAGIQLPRFDNRLSESGRSRITQRLPLLKIYTPWQRPGKSDLQSTEYQLVTLQSVSLLHRHIGQRRTTRPCPNLRPLCHLSLPSLGYVAGHKRVFWTFRLGVSHQRRQRFGCLKPRA